MNNIWMDDGILVKIKLENLASLIIKDGTIFYPDINGVPNFSCPIEPSVIGEFLDGTN